MDCLTEGKNTIPSLIDALCSAAIYRGYKQILITGQPI